MAEIEIESLAYGEDGDAGKALILCRGADGSSYEIKLNPLDIQSLSGSLYVLLKELAAHRAAESRAAPEVSRMELILENSSEMERLRLYVSEQVFHEYSARSDTNIGRYFRALGDLIGEDQMSQAVAPPPKVQ